MERILTSVLNNIMSILQDKNKPQVPELLCIKSKILADKLAREDLPTDVDFNNIIIVCGEFLMDRVMLAVHMLAVHMLAVHMLAVHMEAGQEFQKYYHYKSNMYSQMNMEKSYQQMERQEIERLELHHLFII